MLQNMCRICAVASDAKEVTKLFEKSTRKLLRQINLLTGVFLEASSDIPDVICKICLNDLVCAIEFRRRCLRNHKRWQLKRTTNPEPESESTQSNNVRRSARTRERVAGETVDEVPLSPLEVLIKVELPKLEENEEESVDHLETVDFSEPEEEISGTPVKIKRRSRLMKQPRIKQKLPVFFCDQCGNNVTGKSAFDRHLRKHSGIRPFQCEQCPARFLSAGELKGHQVMHTGDRNFPCRFCERTYVNYSGRLRHERTHTNERPFACCHCGKAFTNSYILKNHMLVHTGERMFRCDLCDRAFSRPTHLKTHYRSNTHKQNVEKSCEAEQQLLKIARLQSDAGFTNNGPQVDLSLVEIPLSDNQY